MIDRELMMVGALCIGVVVIAFTLWKVNRDKNIDFSLLDLLMENGKVSKISCIVLGSFAATTWAFIYDCLQRKGVDATTMGAYGALWILPLMARFMGNGHAKPESPT